VYKLKVDATTAASEGASGDRSRGWGPRDTLIKEGRSHANIFSTRRGDDGARYGARGAVTQDEEVWGRPVGLLQLADGSLLMTDDGGKKIWRIAYRGAQTN